MTGDTPYTLLYYPHNIDDLLELGVGDPRWSGSTPLIGAVVSGQPSIVQWLVDHGAARERENQAWLDAAARGRRRVLRECEEGIPAGRGDHSDGNARSRSEREPLACLDVVQAFRPALHSRPKGLHYNLTMVIERIGKSAKQLS